MSSGKWLVDYLVAKDCEPLTDPPADAARVTITVEADSESKARDRARVLIFRQHPDDVKWEREARPAVTEADREWSEGVGVPGGKEIAWPLPWQRGTDKYNSWCVDCQGEARVYDGHIHGYDHKAGCPNR